MRGWQVFGKRNNRCLLSLYLEAIGREMLHNRISRNQKCDLSGGRGKCFGKSGNSRVPSNLVAIVSRNVF